MRLRIIRTSGNGAERERIIGREALVIGRGDDCDWVLPDPERTLSKHHCEVAFQGAVYMLRDTSTNGVFLNDSAEPVGRGKAVVLKHGDRFRAAAFGFRVEVLASEAPAPAAPSVIDAAEGPARPAFVDPGSAIDGGSGPAQDSFDAFALPPASGPDPLGAAGTFASDWGGDSGDPGFSGAGFGAFDAPAPGGRRAQIPDDLDLIPLGVPAPDDPWSTPPIPAQPDDLRQMAAQMIEALVQLERQQEAALRQLGLDGAPIPALEALPGGSGETMLAHLCAMPDDQGLAAVQALSREMVARSLAILTQLDAQPNPGDAPSSDFSSFEDDPFA